jgi:hypothetical protein
VPIALRNTIIIFDEFRSLLASSPTIVRFADRFLCALGFVLFGVVLWRAQNDLVLAVAVGDRECLQDHIEAHSFSWTNAAPIGSQKSSCPSRFTTVNARYAGC